MDDPLWRTDGGLLDLDPDTILAAVATRGALHLRGAAPTVDTFEAFTRRLCGEFAVHQRASRRFVSPDGTTQTVTAGADAVPLHRERSYLPVAPDLLFFACVRPASDGGETLLCDGVELAASLPSALREAVDRRLRCVTWAPPEEWQRSLTTSARAGAAREMRRMLLAYPDPELADLDWGFEGGRLRLAFTAPCLREVDGRACFANFVLHYLFRDEGFADTLRITFADGAEIPEALGRRIEACAAPITHPVRWQAGDVLVVDNGRMMHGRTAFSDLHREVYVRMGYSAPDRRLRGILPR